MQHIRKRSREEVKSSYTLPTDSILHGSRLKNGAVCVSINVSHWFLLGKRETHIDAGCLQLVLIISVVVSRLYIIAAKHH
jgi:hypothetical protein